MNSLSKTDKELLQTEYRNWYSTKRSEKKFEWCGEYHELYIVFARYMKEKDNILIVGCGNFTTSLCVYGVGYRNITNIDVSHIVNKQICDVNTSVRSDFLPEQMDPTEMIYPDDTFNVVLDKATLDALMPDTKEETISMVNKYFKEVTRVLRNGGRYICISLLPEHILRHLLSYFPTSGFMFRIIRCQEAEVRTQIEKGSSVPIFAVIATKLVRLSQTILELVFPDSSPKRLSSINDMITAVWSIQRSAFLHNRGFLYSVKGITSFKSWDAVRNDCILNLVPQGIFEKRSWGSDVRVTTTCFQGISDLSGPFVVEEIEKDGSEFRRLIFLNSPYVVQSEARLKQAKSRRGKMKKIIDPGFLACDHHLYMSIGVSAAISSKESDEIMIIGLGGGGLCTFLYNCFPKLKITAVEIDETMLKVATDYFGLILDNRMKVEIADGIQFIKETATNGRKYKAILFDVDSKGTTVGMNCPPKLVVEMSTIKSVTECLTNDGFFILNLISRDESIKKKVKSDLKSIFKSMACYSVQDKVNEVIICSLNGNNCNKWKHKLQTAATILNEQVSARKLLNGANMFDLSSTMKNLCIE